MSSIPTTERQGKRFSFGFCEDGWAVVDVTGQELVKQGLSEKAAKDMASVLNCDDQAESLRQAMAAWKGA